MPGRADTEAAACGILLRWWCILLCCDVDCRLISQKAASLLLHLLNSLRPHSHCFHITRVQIGEGSMKAKPRSYCPWETNNKRLFEYSFFFSFNFSIPLAEFKVSFRTKKTKVTHRNPSTTSKTHMKNILKVDQEGGNIII